MSNRNDILIRVLADLGDLKAQLKQVERNTSSSAKRIESSFDNITVAAGKVFLAYQSLQAVSRSVEAFLAPSLGFEQAMAEVRTLLGVTDAEFHHLASSIEDLSLRVPQSAEQLAKGLYQVISSGVTDTAEALEVLETSARAAVGGVSDTFTAVDAVTTILNSYGLAADRAGYVSDLLFQTVKEGKTTLGELAPVIGRVTPLAANLGLSLEELFGAIATLTAGGIRTEQAITGVLSFLRSLSVVSEDGKRLAQELGIQWDTSIVKSRGLIGTMQLLKDVTGGNAEQIKKLVNDSEGWIAALALTGDQADALAGKVESMNEALGASEEAFGKMETGANNLVIIKNNFSEFVRTITDGVLPALSLLSDGLPGLIVLLKGVLAILVGVTAGFVAYKIAVFAAYTGTMEFAFWVGAATAKLKYMWLALAANPIVLATGVLATLVAGLWLFVDVTEEAAASQDAFADSTGLATDELITQKQQLEGATKALEEYSSGLASAGAGWLEELRRRRDAFNAEVERIYESIQGKSVAELQAMLETVDFQSPAEKAITSYLDMLEKNADVASRYPKIPLPIDEEDVEEVVKLSEEELAAVKRYNARMADAAAAEEERMSRSRETRIQWLSDQLQTLEIGTAQWEQYVTEFDRLMQEGFDEGLAKAEQSARNHVDTVVRITSEIASALSSSFASIWVDGERTWKEGAKRILIAMLDAMRAKMAIVKAWMAAESIVNFLSVPGNLAKLATTEALFAAARAVVYRMEEGAVVNRPTLAWIGEKVGKTGPEIVAPEHKFKEWQVQFADKVLRPMLAAGSNDSGAAEAVREGLRELKNTLNPRTTGRVMAEELAAIQGGRL